MDIRGNGRCFCGGRCRRSPLHRQDLDRAGDSLDRGACRAESFPDAETFFDGNGDRVDGSRWFPGFPKHARYRGVRLRICDCHHHAKFGVCRDRVGAGDPDQLEQSLLGTTFSG